MYLSITFKGKPISFYEATQEEIEELKNIDMNKRFIKLEDKYYNIEYIEHWSAIEFIRNENK